MASGTGRPKVVVVGAGFGGLSVCKHLGNRGCDVLLLDRNNYHGFWPLLYQVATGALDSASIAYPIRGVIRPYKNVDFQLANVTGVDWDKQEVLVENGKPIHYDFLVLAAGSAQFYFGNDALATGTFSMKDVDEAEQIRNHVIRCFEAAQVETDPEKKKQLMTVAIVGGGPTGVELAGGYVELFGLDFKKDFPSLDMSQARVVMIEAMGNIMLPFSDPNSKDPSKPSDFQAGVKNELERRGVEVLTNKPVDAVENNVVKFKDGSELAAGTVIWAAGVRGALLADNLGIKLQRGFRVEVTEHLNLPDKPNVFVIGDMAYLEGFKWGERTMAYPMLAQVAIQMGQKAAENINVMASGGAPSTFKYKDKGSMAIIGRSAAIVNSPMYKMHLAGGNSLSRFFGWVMWLFVHVQFLFGWRNRIVAIFNWVWNWLKKDRGARVLTGKVDEKTEKVVASN
jgi:NADH dehydrogenase